MSYITLPTIVTLLPLAAFILLFIFQLLWPRRDLSHSGFKRILHNLFLFVVNSVLQRLFIPLTLVAVASWAESNQFGFFQLWSLPEWILLAVSIVLLDFSVYWQHLATHKLPILWRVHKVHHSDKDMDVTTAIRFHPFELLLSTFYKSAVVVLLGVPVIAVIVFELLLFISPVFNHSNLKLPTWLDKAFHSVFVTPDMHRIHHSVHRHEHDSNYGFCLILWDKIFSSYSERPEQPHESMQIGLKDKSAQSDRVDQMLLLPFK